MKPKNFDIHNKEWKKEIPVPVFDEKPEYLELYWKAWELAWDHVKEIPGMPQTPYMDEAFVETDIWIWDTCFMMFFCKYAPNVFPGIETLNNFYQPLYGGKPLPIIVATEDIPEWTGAKPGERVPLLLHIPDNPPLFAWAEYSYALMTGDIGHLKELLLEKQYLQKHFEWLENLKEQVILPYCRNITCWIKHDDGYCWEGGRSGMDNTPRGRLNGKAGDIHRPNNPKILWVDAIAQQGLSALYIAKSAELIGEKELAEKWMRIYREFKDKVNRLYWDAADSMYYDIHDETKEFMKCLTPASFWPLLADMPDKTQVEGMVEYLCNPRKLGGMVPWTTVARDDADFDSDGGHYWRGSVWLPTAYMGIKGIENYGKFELANENARKIVEHMYRTYKEYSPHTIWECYAPNTPKPATDPDGTNIVRRDFCGWSALGPISLFIENVIGIHAINAFTNTVEWHLPPDIKGKIGVRNLSFGDVVTDIVYENGKCKVTSNAPYRLLVDDKEYPVKAGSNEFKVG